MITLHRLRMSILLLGLISIFGCSSRKNVLVPEDFFAKPSSVQLLWGTEADEGEVYRGGQQGLLEIAANKVVGGGMEGALAEIKVARLVTDKLLGEIAQGFSARGFQVSARNEPLDISELEKPKGNAKNLAPYDVNPYINAGTSYALLVVVQKFGATRTYFSVIPTGAPQGYTQLDAYLINLADNTVLAEQHPEVTLDVLGASWDTPPGYEALIATSKKAFSEAMAEVRHNFLRADIALAKVQ